MANITNNNEILLEAGTNELMIMEFCIGDSNYGINVAKVLEIMRYEPVTPIPHSNQFIEGVFKPRNDIITVVNLPAYLGLSSSTDTHNDIMIITSFNNTNTAFHVHNVEMIHRISWTDMEKPASSIYNDENNLTVGIVRLGEKLITILDFEKIMSEIDPAMASHSKEFTNKKKIDNKHPIFIAEDSIFLMGVLEESLHNSGYSNLTKFSNGKECLDALYRIKKNETEENIKDHVSLLITDIEMPMMDGHALTKAIKDDPALRQIPVIIFSSLINEAMRFKGQQVGADEQLSKPEIHSLVDLIEKYI